MTTTADAILTIIRPLIFGLIILWAARTVWTGLRTNRVTVQENQAGLRLSKGQVTRVLPAGEYSTWLTSDRIVLVDQYEQSQIVSGQEMLTQDNLPVRVSMILVYRISDPRTYYLSGGYPEGRMYESAQVHLRTAVAGQTLEALLENRDLAIDGLAEALGDDTKALGIEIINVQLRDFTLSGAAKQAYADIWKAQKEGLAALERARGEQAALRALNNAARMLKNNPELMNLRLLQALNGAPGANAPTIVLGGSTGLTPLDGETPDEPKKKKS